MTLYTSQSQIIEAQRCPRRRWWSHFALPEPCTCGEPGTMDMVPDPSCPDCLGTGTVAGISPERKSVPLLLGGTVHHGLDVLLRTGDLDQAVTALRADYSEALTGTSLELNPTEEQSYVAGEQIALGEALLQLAALRVLPGLLAKYEVVWVERDFQQELAPGVILRGRVDALLRERETGDLFILNWKTKGDTSIDDRALEDAQHDDQGLSETWLVERWLSGEGYNLKGCAGPNPPYPVGLPTETSGVLMCWLLKGERRESKKGSGVWQQASPLIRGYRRFNSEGREDWVWSYYWDDPQSASRRQLGPGWEKVDMWREPGGVRAWVDRLATGTVQPEAGDCLAAQWVMPAPYYRQPADITDWIEDAAEQETEALERRDAAWNGGRIPRRQHRHSCSYPSRCPFYSLCWSAPHIRENPLENGFVRRKAYQPKTEATDGAK